MFLDIDQQLLTQDGKRKVAQIAKALRDAGIGGGDGDNGYMSGCTALVALITKDQIIIANAGDCRAFVITDEIFIFETVEHRPGNPA